MRFCADHRDDLDAALASLPTNASSDATSNPPTAQTSSSPNPANPAVTPPAVELSRLLLSLRKLREAILSTATKTPVEFAQRVHVFSIRLSILAQHPPSYFHSLKYCVDKLHSKSHPFQESEVKELISYLILDYACRQDDMVAAFDLRTRARKEHAFHSQTIDRILAALMHDNWVVFWQVRKSVDSYFRAVMNWAVDRVRRHALKAMGSAYLNVHVSWIMSACTGDDERWTWDKLVETEKLGWQKEGEKVIIRRPRPRPPPSQRPAPTTAPGS